MIWINTFCAMESMDIATQAPLLYMLGGEQRESTACKLLTHRHAANSGIHIVRATNGVPSKFISCRIGSISVTKSPNFSDKEPQLKLVRAWIQVATGESLDEILRAQELHSTTETNHRPEPARFLLWRDSYPRLQGPVRFGQQEVPCCNATHETKSSLETNATQGCYKPI